MSYQRTTQTLQNDTFDSVAYRFFGNQSNDYLPLLVALNPQYAPYSILPSSSIIILPTIAAVSTNKTIKIWD